MNRLITVIIDKVMNARGWQYWKGMPKTISLLIITTGVLSATVTSYNYWHAAYFDVDFIANYGSSEQEWYVTDMIARSQVVIQLDSILKDLRKNGKLEHFTHWTLVDDYTKSYDYKNGKPVPGKLRIADEIVYLCLTDSISLNYALKKLWHIDRDDVIISPRKKSGMWLFSLHFGYSKNRLWTRRLSDTLDSYLRPDSNQLWLRCKSGWVQIHSWYQHEIDDYYHKYTGLYLTKENVIAAQRLIRKQTGIISTFVSHYVTPAILRSYVLPGF